MTPSNPKVDTFIERASRWREEMTALRAILLGCGLREELKWGKPCYTAAGANIVIMQPFEPHLALMFFKGALLDDPAGILRSQGPNTQSALRVEFTDPAEVAEHASTLKAYVDQAIAVEEAGLEVPARKAEDEERPPELEERLRADEVYREAFDALTPGRRRSYLLHFSGAKQSKTRVRRIEKCRDKVLEGKGFNER